MEYAIIKSGGKQYKVSPGGKVEVDRLEVKKDAILLLQDVLLHAVDGSISIGRPIVSGVLVKAKVLDNTKGKKIYVSKFKAKARSRRTTGFRSSKTLLEIIEITENAKTSAKTSQR